MNIRILVDESAVKYRSFIEEQADKIGIGVECRTYYESSDIEAEDFVHKFDPHVIIFSTLAEWDFWPTIKKIKNESAEKREVVLISDTPDFELAYKAYQHRVLQFLLEPIDEQQLQTFLKDEWDKRQFIAQVEKQEEKLKTYELARHQKLMGKIMTHMMEKPDELALMLNEINARYNTTLEQAYFFSIQLSIGGVTMSRTPEGLLERLQNQIETGLTKAYEVVAVIQDMFLISAVVNIACDNYTPQMLKELTAMEGLIEKIMSDYEVEEWAIGIGPVVGEISRLAESAELAKYAYHYRVKCDQKIFIADQLPALDRSRYVLDGDSRRSLFMGFKQMRIKPILTRLEEMYSNNRSGHPYNCQLMTEQLCELIKEAWNGYLDERDLEDAFDGRRYNNIYEPRKKYRLLVRAIEDMAAQIEAATPEGINDKIEAALSYIHHHFGEPLTMDHVALEVDLSPNYFSNLFREQIGQTYLDYLTGHRLKQSAKRLKETTDTVAVIANDVGYQDVKYFSRLFKKRYGMTPGVYRKSDVEMFDQ